jgi:glycosyltransferase involved in cell wall biosynthesis
LEFRIITVKIALVYDRVNKIGGAERVLETLHEIFPEAPLYTAVYNPETAPWAKKFKVIPSFLQKLPLAKSRHEVFPYFMPLAFESFDFDEYDVVISVTSEAAKGILTKPQTFHLCYCLTPTRYLWSGYKDYFRKPYFRFFSSPLVAYLKAWDKIACQRPDTYLAISENVKKRIKKYYHRNSEVIYPPLDLEKWKTVDSRQKTESYFLLVSRLVSYKKVNLVIEAFNQLGLPLKIVGKGIQETILKRKAKKNIEFLGQLTDKELLGYYQNCQALIFPQEEDFGLVPLEAQACGKPVIAFGGGGALETIIEGRTGEFFSPQTSEALVSKLQSFKATKYKPEACRQQAEKFGKEIFKKRFKGVIERLIKQK